MGLFQSLKEKKEQKQQEALQRKRGEAQYYRKLADEGDKEAQYKFGFFYATLDCDTDEAYEQGKRVGFEYLVRAAQKVSDEHEGMYGHDEAAYEVGRCYAYGLGVEKNYFEANGIFVLLLSKYGERYRHFYHIMEARRHMRRMAEEAYKRNSGDVDAIFDYAVSLIYGITNTENYEACQEKGFRLLRVAVDNGHAQAMLILHSYRNKVQVDKDYRVMAAIKGDARAQWNLGWEFWQQDDLDNSLEWFEAAARQGHAKGQKMAGAIYRRRVNSDLEKAEEWLRKSLVWRADIDYAPPRLSYFLLGKIYWDKGGYENHVEALEFYRQGMELEEGLSTEIMQALGENSCTYMYDLTKRTMESQPYRDLHKLQ